MTAGQQQQETPSPVKPKKEEEPVRPTQPEHVSSLAAVRRQLADRAKSESGDSK